MYVKSSWIFIIKLAEPQSVASETQHKRTAMFVVLEEVDSLDNFYELEEGYNYLESDLGYAFDDNIDFCDSSGEEEVDLEIAVQRECLTCDSQWYNQAYT